MGNVLPPGTDKLDGQAEGQGHFDGIRDKIGRQPPPETAPDEQGMDHHFLSWQTGDLHGHRMGAVGGLGGGPNLAHAVMDMGSGVHRLHRGVIDVGHLVDRLQLFPG